MNMSMNTWLLVGAGFLVFGVMLAYLVVSRMKKGVYRNTIDELEILKYEISNKPVMFEIAKLKTVRKSTRIVELVAEWEKRWKDLEEQLKIADDNIAYAEESIASGEFESAEETIDVTGKDLAELNEKVEALLLEIENLKSSELRNRAGIVKLREAADRLKEDYSVNQAQYASVSTQIQDAFRNFEALFAQFDEHMEESNYDLADEVSDQIQEKIDLIVKLFEKIPMYRESVESEAMPLLNGVLDSYFTMVDNGLYLAHLNIESEVKNYREQLDQITELLQRFEFERIESLIVNVMDQAKKLRDAMKQELDIKEAFEADLAKLKIDANLVLKEGRMLQERYGGIKGHCLMKSDDEENFYALLREINVMDAGVASLLEEVGTGAKAISSVHTSVLSYLVQIGEIIEQLRIFEGEINILYQGSEEIKVRAIALLNDVNKLRSKFEKVPFDKNVSRLQLILDKVDGQVIELLEEANKSPMDVANVQVIADTTTRVVEMVKKEVGLAVEQLRMAERLLVYGNRYIAREGMYLMDLTIAEDQFHQGNYEHVIDAMYKILTDVEGNDFFKVFENLKQELGCLFI